MFAVSLFVRTSSKIMSRKISNSRCLPAWYQELSDKQIDAADALHHHLEVDMVLGETKMVRQCLRGIGIKPLPSAAILNEIISMSRGSDLLMLWALWQLAYESSSEDSFALNERLVFSAICHLDMVTTLRALDQMLPRYRPKTQIRRTKSSIGGRQWKLGIGESPYLQRLPRPQHRPQRRCQPPKWPEISLQPYGKYADCNYVVVNERTRWYANIQQDAPRMAESPTATLNAEIKQSIIANICSLHSDKKTRVSTHLSSLVQCCRVDNNHSSNFATASIVKASANSTQRRAHDPIYTTITFIALGGVENAAEFERLARIYFHKQSLRKCAKSLIEHSAKLKCIQICPHCSYCRQFNGQYIKSIGNYEKSISRRVRFVDQVIDYGQFIDDYVYRSAEHDDEILAMDLDGAAAEQLSNGCDGQSTIVLCMKSIRTMDIVLWMDYKRTKWMDIAWNTAFSDEEDLLLSTALEALHSNPKFVLASLPDAHLVPALREWWRHRCGHRWTRIDRMRALSEDRDKWNKFVQRFFEIDEPKVEDVFGGRTVASYGNQDIIKKRIANLNRDYYRRLSNALIDRQRIFWGILRPSLCSTGPPRHTYFAYMPSNEYDVHACGSR